jgi:pimeloyl-ACP methyl ester carboxylesterase
MGGAPMPLSGTSSAQSFRLVALNLPGLGKSPRRQNRTPSPNDFAADLRAVIDAIGNSTVVLVGHSIGAMTLLSFAGAYRDYLNGRVRGLVLAHGTYTNPLHTMKMSSILVPLQKWLIEPLLWLCVALSPLLRVVVWLSYLNGSLHRSNDNSEPT